MHIMNKHDSFTFHAMRFYELGFSPLPAEPGSKMPLIKWREFQTQRPTQQQIELWGRQWPNANIMLVLGPVGNLFAIDVDGTEAHTALCRACPALTQAPMALSGSGQPYRYHLYFRHPSISTRAKITPWCSTLEFRGLGGTIIAPPSIHPSGNRYRWAPGRSVFEMPLPELPPNVREALRRHAQQQAERRLPSPGDDATTTPIIRCSRMHHETQRFLEGRYAHASGWNDRLFQAACDLCGCNVPFEQAKVALLKSAKPRTPEDETQAIATIESAYSERRMATIDYLQSRN